MAEYIERGTGVSIFRAKANMAVLMDAAPYFEKAAQMLEQLPAADVAPVVRCKNCRSYNKPKTGWCEVHLDREHPDDFCGYGEQKDGGASNG